MALFEGWAVLESLAFLVEEGGLEDEEDGGLIKGETAIVGEGLKARVKPMTFRGWEDRS